MLVVKNTHANAADIKDIGSVLRSGRSPGGGHDNPLQYYCLAKFYSFRLVSCIIES